LCFNQKEEGK
jgi:hypothetical protein